MQRTLEYQQEELSVLKKIEAESDYVLQIKYPSNDELELAFDLNPELALQFKVLSVEIQKFIVLKDPINIQYIVKPKRSVELYVVNRGYLDHHIGNYYWKIIGKKPHSWAVRFAMQPIVGSPIPIISVIIRVIIARPVISIFYGIRIVWSLLSSKKKKVDDIKE